MADRIITERTAPTPQEMSALGKGDTVWIFTSAEFRHDWGPCFRAVMSAAWRGADIRRVWD